MLKRGDEGCAGSCELSCISRPVRGDDGSVVAEPLSKVMCCYNPVSGETQPPTEAAQDRVDENQDVDVGSRWWRARTVESTNRSSPLAPYSSCTPDTSSRTCNTGINEPQCMKGSAECRGCGKKPGCHRLGCLSLPKSMGTQAKLSCERVQKARPTTNEKGSRRPGKGMAAAYPSQWDARDVFSYKARTGTALVEKPEIQETREDGSRDEQGRVFDDPLECVLLNADKAYRDKMPEGKAHKLLWQSRASGYRRSTYVQSAVRGTKVRYLDLFSKAAKVGMPEGFVPPSMAQ